MKQTIIDKSQEVFEEFYQQAQHVILYKHTKKEQLRALRTAYTNLEYIQRLVCGMIDTHLQEKPHYGKKDFLDTASKPIK